MKTNHIKVEVPTKTGIISIESEIQNPEQSYEMGYVVTKLHQEKFLILVNARESPHAKGFPHAHLQKLNTDPIACFFITEETPKDKDDLRFVNGTYKSPIPSDYKKSLVNWANRSYRNHKELNLTNWDYLKEYHGTLWPSGLPPNAFPHIADLVD
jgi:hypothetical protein